MSCFKLFLCVFMVGFYSFSGFAISISTQFKQGYDAVQRHTPEPLRPTINKTLKASYDKRDEKVLHARAQSFFMIGLAFMRATQALHYHYEIVRQDPVSMTGYVQDVKMTGDAAIQMMMHALSLQEKSLNIREGGGKKTIYKQKMIRQINENLDVFVVQHRAFLAQTQAEL